jgi:peptidoglycan/LPS O-acetylase OafA/YrhL
MTAENTLQKRHVFETLDGMRGIAAVCVALMHAQIIFGVWPYSGFLAVDFFFVLSGFVISFACPSSEHLALLVA